MSVQFGRWNVDGRPVDWDYLEKAKAYIAPYGPDDGGSYSNNNISIVYRAFHTTKESRRETQPHVTSRGAVITWDGRLDNRADLIRRLGDLVTTGSTDVEIVAAAYEYGSYDCFGMLIGDWALSIWDPHRRSLILAKDPTGTHHLYYSFDNYQVTWSTILDPLVLLAKKSFLLCEEYIAGWFLLFPAAHLTPYEGIHSVPPSCFLCFRDAKHTITRYWDFNPGRKIRYRTDAEYEEHFRTVFAEAVRRTLRSDRPVLAELSGGMDSSAIVCMADQLITSGACETPRLDTISYYDDSEPNWNERPYFAKVEEKRGRVGCHIDICSQESLSSNHAGADFAATPCSGSHLTEASRQLAAQMVSQGNRIVLSGVGGDETMGGVPNPLPELEDLLAQASFKSLARQLKLWALQKRKPWFHLLLEASRGFFPTSLVGVPKPKQPAPWLNCNFVKRNRVALQGYDRRLKLFGPLPTFQENISTLEALRRQLESCAILSEPPFVKRYPYLDRNLLEFIYALPRKQLIRPGQRRSLMRRALADIVPHEILNRKRKAFVVRAPRAAISAAWSSLAELREHMLTGSLGIVDRERFFEALQDARRGQEVQMLPLLRTLRIEFWLTNLSQHGILARTYGVSSER